MPSSRIFPVKRLSYMSPCCRRQPSRVRFVVRLTIGLFFGKVQSIDSKVWLDQRSLQSYVGMHLVVNGRILNFLGICVVCTAVRSTGDSHMMATCAWIRTAACCRFSACDSFLLAALVHPWCSSNIICLAHLWSRINITWTWKIHSRVGICANAITAFLCGCASAWGHRACKVATWSIARVFASCC